MKESLRKNWHLLRRVFQKRRFPGTAEYWQRRYATGGNSGGGSYGRLAEFKAEFLNDFVRIKKIASIIEFGCGDGNQLALSGYPAYIGYDVSPESIRMCREKFQGDPTKRFALLEDWEGERADLALSLDVIYHLIEEKTFRAYMRRLFEASTRFVIIYSSNIDQKTESPHVRHRKFSDWVDANCGAWRQLAYVPNRFPVSTLGSSGSHSDFYVYERIGTG